MFTCRGVPDVASVLFYVSSFHLQKLSVSSALSLQVCSGGKTGVLEGSSGSPQPVPEPSVFHAGSALPQLELPSTCCKLRQVGARLWSCSSRGPHLASISLMGQSLAQPFSLQGTWHIFTCISKESSQSTESELLGQHQTAVSSGA